ncbi:haloacid dehalogenase-like hydrolase [Streptomyces sp. NPDC000070]|uniref:HAD family hydrolase n=1 Tax=Streptomyces sp. NPDC000070 TaxID=3154240 RepID=UPI003332D47D
MRPSHPPHDAAGGDAPSTATSGVAVFDLDGTILASDLVESYLWTRLALLPQRSWPGELLNLIVAAPRYLMAERMDRARFVHAFLRRYAGTDERALRRAVGGPVGEALLHRARPEAISRIRAHRAAGHRTVLVTGGLKLLVEPLRPLFDDIQAGTMPSDAGLMTGRLSAPPTVGEERVTWLLSYAAAHGAEPADVHAYADSFSDKALLDAVGNPHAVNPDARLLAYAVHRGWPVERWGRHTGSRWEALAVAARGSRGTATRPSSDKSNHVLKETT